MKDTVILGVVASVAAMLIYDLLKRDLATLGQAVNPIDDKNVINTWFGTAYSQVTGSDQSFGADVYDWIH